MVIEKEPSSLKNSSVSGVLYGLTATFTEHVSVTVLSEFDVTVIVASPSPTPVTLPFASTVATSSSLDDQVTLLSVASSGRTVATRVASSPVEISSSVSLRRISLTSTYVSRPMSIEFSHATKARTTESSTVKTIESFLISLPPYSVNLAPSMVSKEQSLDSLW